MKTVTTFVRNANVFGDHYMAFIREQRRTADLDVERHVFVTVARRPVPYRPGVAKVFACEAMNALNVATREIRRRDRREARP